jgi:glycosyltransferase involved in cell wall biosynthesis
MNSVVFYSESRVLGGHENMALAAHRAILRYSEQITILWLINANNERLAATLDFAGVEYTALDVDPTFRWIRNPLSILKKTLRTTRILRRLKPDLVVLIQGAITDGLDGVLAACLARTPCCSYIPLTHSPSELALHRLLRLRTAVFSVLFRLISRYITIDEQQAVRLRRWRTSAQIAVVENFISSPAEPAQRAREVKQRIGLPADSIVLGVVGRIDFRQKAQDWLVDALKDHQFLQNKALVFIGDGPDSAQLTRLIESSPWHSHIFQLGWRSDLERIYSALDVLIIPSRMEGVPLVMLEALLRHIPVVGTDRDGMKSWLPPEWRFPFLDAEAVRQSIECALRPPSAEHWAAIDRRLATVTDELRFAHQFSQTLIAYCSQLPPMR